MDEEQKGGESGGDKGPQVGVEPAAEEPLHQVSRGVNIRWSREKSGFTRGKMIV